MHATPNRITYEELMHDIAVPEGESQAWLDFLITRGVAKANGDLWINNDHQLDIERITFCLQHSIHNQDWASLSLSINHNKTLPECL